MKTEHLTHQIDKSTWPDGPWKSEPDRVQWQHAGYACLIVRNTLGNLCGYVGVDSSHSYYGRHYDSCNVSVHGGLTYADKCSGPICHVPEPGMPDDVWWLGFDCAHAGDLVPRMPIQPSYSSYDMYRDIEYVNGPNEQACRTIEGKGNL